MSIPRIFLATLFVFATCLTANAQRFYFAYSGMTYVIDFPTSPPVTTPENELTYPTSTTAPVAEAVSKLGTEPVAQPQNYYPTNSYNTSMSRDQIRSTDILNRPYRPGHFYGNTVRRRHHRGR